MLLKSTKNINYIFISLIEAKSKLLSFDNDISYLKEVIN